MLRLLSLFALPLLFSAQHSAAGSRDELPAKAQVEKMLQWEAEVLNARMRIDCLDGVVHYGPPRAASRDFEEIELRQSTERRFAFESGKRRSDTPRTIRVLNDEQLLTRVVPSSPQYTDKVTIRTPGDDINPVDGRLIGLIPGHMETLYNLNLRDYFGSDRENLQSLTKLQIRENVGDEKLVTISCEFQNENRLKTELWIDPNRGPGIVRHVRECTIKGRDGEPGQFVTSMNVKLGDFDGVWFPKAIFFENQFDGRVTNREVQLVQELKVGGDVPDDQFSLATMGLPPGGQVNDLTGERMKAGIWDGTEVKSFVKALRDARVEQFKSDTGGVSFTKKLLLGNLILIVVVACFYWFERRKQKTRSRSALTED